MLNLSEKDKASLVKAYKAFYDRAIQVVGGNLSIEEKRAVGQKILDDIFEKAFANNKTSEEERSRLKKEFEELIKQECHELLSDTPLVFTEQGFHKK